MGNESTANVLLFEDDPHFTELVKQVLKSSGHHVIDFSEYPKDEKDILSAAESQPIDLIIIDFNLPGINGLEICQRLRAGVVDESIPILFLSGEKDDDIILKCYESGAEDFVIKPISPSQLKAKLDRALQLSFSSRQLKRQLENSREVAMKALTTSSELGEIIQFLEKSFECNEYEDVAKNIFKVLKQTGLRTSIKIYHTKGSLCLCDDGESRDLESKVIDQFKNEGRIFDFKQRTLINYPHISILVKNMPKSDQEAYVKYKDNLCLLLNGAEARIAAIETDKMAERQSSQITTTAEVIKMMINEIEQSNIELSQQFRDVIERLEITITHKLMHFNLLESEENELLEVISNSIKEASEIFDKSIEQERKFKTIMNDLAQTLGKK